MDKRLLKYNGVKTVLTVLAVLTLGQSIAIVYGAVSLANVVAALFAGAPVVEQTEALASFFIAFITRHGASFLQQKAAERFAEKTGTNLRNLLMEHLFQNGFWRARSEGSGNLVTLLLEGVSQFRTYLALFLPRVVAMAVTPAVLLAFVFMQDRISAVILIVTLPILIVFLILVGMAARNQMERQWSSYRLLSNHFTDSLRGLETLKFLGMAKVHGETIRRVSDEYRRATNRTLRVAFLSSFVLDFFTMLSVASVAVSLGLRLVDGRLALVEALTVLILAPEYFLPVRMVGADYHATLTGREAGEAMHALLDRLKAESSAPPENVEAFEWTRASTLALTSVTVKREADGPASLMEVSLQIKGVQKVGIVGASGAGKSTLIDVLAGFVQPTSGQIVLNGTTQKTLTIDAWRKMTVYIPQHPYIFNLSLFDNVRFYTPNATREAVEQAIQAVGLSETVATFPNGYDEWLGDGGRQLSGGQEQRIALARALLSDRPIVLLDEPTAHLDIETEYELKETILSLFADKLILLATHRLHWMPHMDHIVVLERGRVVESGTHAALSAKKGVYVHLIRSQQEGVHIR